MRYPSETKIEWFGGNEDVQITFNCLAVLLHTWDDLIDKDVKVSQDKDDHEKLVILKKLQ